MNRILLAFVLLATLSAPIGQAQVATGNIRGTVSDASGGVLPNCSPRGGWGIFFSNREQNDQTTDMAMSLLNFRIINMPQVLRDTTVTPPYRFNSPLVVDNLLDPQFSKFTATSPLSSDAGSSNAANIPFSPFPMLQQYNLSLQYELLSNLLVETTFAGARGVHWVQRIDLNQVTFASALLGKNTQADRPLNFLASSMGLDTADVSNWILENFPALGRIG